MDNTLYRNCPHCGRQIPADSNCCPYCKQDVPPMPQQDASGTDESTIMPAADTNATSAQPLQPSGQGAQNTAPNTQATQQPQVVYIKEPKSNLGPWIFATALVVVLIGCLGYFLATRNGSSGNGSSDDIQALMDSVKQARAVSQAMAAQSTQSQQAQAPRATPTRTDLQPYAGEAAWRIRKVGGLQNIRDGYYNSGSSIPMRLKAYTQYLIYTNYGPMNGEWYRITRIYNETEGRWVRLHSSVTGEYWISSQCIYRVN